MQGTDVSVPEENVVPEGTRVEHFYRALLPPGPYYPTRDEAIRAIVGGRRAIHVGCTDWPITATRLERGELLHSRLMAWCPEVLGVDIDRDGLDVLQAASGGAFACLDVSSDDLAPLLAFQPEVVVACDVIEHVPNLDTFLAGLGQLLRQLGPQSSLLLTTPNALALRNIVYSAAGVEVVHPDHRVVFTPNTLSRSLRSQGLRVREVAYYSISSGETRTRRVFDRATRLAARFRPGFADGLAVTTVAT